MIKPWQKVSLGVIVSVGAYGVFLHTIQATTSHTNQLKAQQRAAQQEKRKLLAEVKGDEASIVQLHLALTRIHQQTLKTRQKIALVNHEIEQLKSGIQVAVAKASQASAKSATIPTPSVSVSQPPPVQAVTTASGA